MATQEFHIGDILSVLTAVNFSTANGEPGAIALRDFLMGRDVSGENVVLLLPQMQQSILLQQPDLAVLLADLSDEFGDMSTLNPFASGYNAQIQARLIAFVAAAEMQYGTTLSLAPIG